MEVLTDQLLAGVYAPGDRLPTEMELARSLGVGRGSVREAVKMLTSLGVLEIRRGEGTFVAESPSPSVVDPLVLSLVFEQRSSRELVELRILLETGAAQLLAEKATDDDLRQLAEANDRLLRAAQTSAPDPQALVELDIAFHTTLNALAGNRLLGKIYHAVSALFVASVKQSVESDPELAHANHAQVIDAIRSRDPQRVQDAVRTSLRSWTGFTA